LLLREEVPAAPAALVELSVPAASESALFLVFVFFEVVAVSPEDACGAVVASTESAGFFFFLLLLAAVESLCD
jgi:hypothetical protein